MHSGLRSGQGLGKSLNQTVNGYNQTLKSNAPGTVPAMNNSNNEKKNLNQTTVITKKDLLRERTLTANR